MTWHGHTVMLWLDILLWIYRVMKKELILEKMKAQMNIHLSVCIGITSQKMKMENDFVTSL
jgi:hypothetical protein